MREPLAILNWSGSMLPAQGELTDSEIVDRYGVLMGDAVSAFRADPTYVVEMAESAASLRAKRQQRSLKRAS